MMDLLAPLINLAIPIVLIAVGLFWGRHNEKIHYQSIHERERRFLHVPATDTRHVPHHDQVDCAVLVHGSVVISIDYFKRIAAGLRQIVGGEVRAYSSLLDRARREALLRMKEACPDADGYYNCRIETASISKGRQNAVGSVEVIAYGTAVRYHK